MFSRLFLIGSFSYLQVVRTYIKAYMSLNFGQIPPLTTELAALERPKNGCHHVISVDIDLIFFKLAGNKDMHNSMNEFEFQPDWTTDYGVSCPWASKKYPYRPYNGENEVISFSRLFLIGSFSYLQVMRTYIKAYMSLNFGQITPLTTELAALERLKNRCHVISVDIDPIFFKLAGNKDMHNIMNDFEFRPDRTTDYGVSCPWVSKKYPYRPYNGENGVSTFSLLFLIGSFWYFHVTRTSIKAWMSWNFFEMRFDLGTLDSGEQSLPFGLLVYDRVNFFSWCSVWVTAYTVYSHVFPSLF